MAHVVRYPSMMVACQHVNSDNQDFPISTPQAFKQTAAVSILLRFQGPPRAFHVRICCAR